MKKLFFVLSLMMGLTVQVKAADQLHHLISCRMLAEIPDMYMKVDLYSGGFTGTTQLQIKKYFMGHATNMETHIVREIPVIHIPGQKILSYQGSRVKLSIQLSSALTKYNGYYSVLEVQENGYTSRQNLSCQLVNRTR